jgi:ketosteroid isomerase-like protein
MPGLNRRWSIDPGGEAVSHEEEVHNASRQFYAALNRMVSGDSGPMAEIWSHGPDVTSMHPIGGREVGWDAVQGAFGQVAHLASAGKVELKNALIRVAGDLAYEVGTEHGKVTLGGHKLALDHRVTNIYRKEAGAWRIVHHHTDISPAMLEALEDLQVHVAAKGR